MIQTPSTIKKYAEAIQFKSEKYLKDELKLIGKPDALPKPPKQLKCMWFLNHHLTLCLKYIR